MYLIINYGICNLVKYICNTEWNLKYVYVCIHTLNTNLMHKPTAGSLTNTGQFFKSKIGK